jgi:hypothetical protein
MKIKLGFATVGDGITSCDKKSVRKVTTCDESTLAGKTAGDEL